MPAKRGKFERCVRAVSRRPEVSDPEAVCALSLRRSGWVPRRNSREVDRLAAKFIREGHSSSVALAEAKRIISLQHRNPAVESAALAEEFHGRTAEPEYIEETEHVHEHLAGLGTLDEIKLRGGVKIRFDGDTALATNEAGTQLFAVGGDQSVDLAQWPDVDDAKELVLLGKVAGIVYTTDKQHLGRADRTPGPYKHKLGEASGDLPELVYDTRSRKLLFVGGHYRITADGIED